MHVMKKAALVLPASALLLLSLATAGAPAAQAAASGSAHSVSPASGYTGACPRGSQEHYYGDATSGFDTHGTAANIWTWKSWSVDSSGKNFSNEAVWMVDNPYPTFDLEVGFYSGWLDPDLNNEKGWWYTNGMTPYYSLDNGINVYVQEGTYLPANTYIGISSFFSGTTSFAVVAGTDGSPVYMDQAIPGLDDNTQQANLQNVEQGEVTDSSTWMGGGSGDNMTLFWVDSSGDQHPWGSLSYCYNSPFWAKSSNDTDYFENGGY
jgi:hypothetical protein